MTVTINFDFTRSTRAAKPRKFSRISDGDTPVIEQPIRMVSCDTPEKAGYAGKPETAQPKLDECKKRLESIFYKNIPLDLRKYFIKKLTANAAKNHIEAGEDASHEFERILEDRLTLANGKKRSIAIIPTGELIDPFGRLLAYIAPWFSGTKNDPVPSKNDPRRRTFNLHMVETGWAAAFPIYPSLPSNDDMELLISAAESAWNMKKGIWEKYGKNILLAYEFRMCVKLGTAKNAKDGMSEAFKRICVDLRDLHTVGKFGFHKVPPCYRMWVWEKDIEQATVDLGLIG